MRYFVFLVLAVAAHAQMAVKVDFAKKLQPWDGFGVNYVEVPQTRDYRTNP